jgi:hypothetical protein
LKPAGSLSRGRWQRCRRPFCFAFARIAELWREPPRPIFRSAIAGTDFRRFTLWHVPCKRAGQEEMMKRSNGLGIGQALAIGFATLPLMVMSWVSYETALTSFA